MQRTIGDVVVTENGELVLITATGLIGEMQFDGTLPIFDRAILLRGDKSLVCGLGTIRRQDATRSPATV